MDKKYEYICPLYYLYAGDLTDAKFLDKRGSKQFDEEWKVYQETVTKCRAMNNNLQWFDLRGNHGKIAM